MTETLRIEQVVSATRSEIEDTSSPITWPQLERRVGQRLKVKLREGDFRAAVWQLIDGGVARFTTDRKVERISG